MNWLWNLLGHILKSFNRQIYACYATCRLYTLTACIQRDSQARVTRNKKVRVGLSTLLPWAPDFGTWYDATARRDTIPLTRTSQTAKKVRANEARHKCSRLHENIRGECFHLHFHCRSVLVSLSQASVFIYILAFALSQFLSTRVVLSIFKNFLIEIDQTQKNLSEWKSAVKNRWSINRFFNFEFLVSSKSLLAAFSYDKMAQ